MRIFNGTTHEINIYNIADCYEIQGGRKLVRKPDSSPIYTVPPGTNLNARKGNRPAPELNVPFEIRGAAIFESYDTIPEEFDLIIVSQLFRAAVIELGGDTSKLAVIDGAVYSDETAVRPCGCTALAVG